jgi:hypothetical protein
MPAPSAFHAVHRPTRTCANDDEVWRFAAAAIRCHAHLITAAPRNARHVHDLDWDDTGQPRSQQFGDQFYSREDGRAECAHVFIAGNGLPARWHGVERFHIAELGFGTGLNFVETWRQWIAVPAPGSAA